MDRVVWVWSLLSLLNSALKRSGFACPGVLDRLVGSQVSDLQRQTSPVLESHHLTWTAELMAVSSVLIPHVILHDAERQPGQGAIWVSEAANMESDLAMTVREYSV